MITHKTSYVATVTLAQEQLDRLCGPRAADRTYDRADFVSLTGSRTVEPEVRAAIHQTIVGMALKLCDKTLRSPLTRGVTVGVVSEQYASASVRRFDDGSALILVSDALIDVLVLLSQLAAVPDAINRRTARRLGRRRRNQARVRMVGAVAATLRLYLIQQMIYGSSRLPEMRLEEPSLLGVSELALGATIFTLAHELAHISLKHQVDQGELAELVGPVRLGERHEIHADAWAYRLLTHVTDEGVVRMDSYSWLTASIGILSVDLCESMLFTRPVTTHPPALLRWNCLLNAVKGGPRGRGGMVGGSMFAMSMAARSLSEPFPNQFFDISEEVQIFAQDADDLAALKFWDRILTCDDGGLREALASREIIDASHVEIASLLCAGNWETALTQLIPDQRQRQRLIAPGQTLSFHRLVTVCRSAIERTSDEPRQPSSLIPGVRIARALHTHLHQQWMPAGLAPADRQQPQQGCGRSRMVRRRVPE